MVMGGSVDGVRCWLEGCATSSALRRYCVCVCYQNLGVFSLSYCHQVFCADANYAARQCAVLTKAMLLPGHAADGLQPVFSLGRSVPPWTRDPRPETLSLDPKPGP
eukprot:1956212-Rhodomonas_salina.7